MQCPFELPVKLKPDYRLFFVTEANGLIISNPLKENQAAYIVQVINSHKKLVNACEKAKWLYDELALSTLGAACKYGDNYEPPTKEDCLQIRELLEQALKEAEKE